MRDKLKALSDLNSSLREPDELGGVFLPRGARERDDVVFLAEMPSLALPKNANADRGQNFSATARDQFFKDMLVKHGLAGVYVTDVVKARSEPRRPTKAEILKWRPFLLDELDIIKPKMVIVIGKRTYAVSFLPYILPFAGSELKHDYIFHYCSQVPRNKFETRLVEVVLKFSLQVQ